MLNRCLASIATATTDPREQAFLWWSAAFNLAAVRSRPRRHGPPRRGARHEAGFVAREKGVSGTLSLGLQTLLGDGGCDFGACGPGSLHPCLLEHCFFLAARYRAKILPALVHKGECVNSFRFRSGPNGSLFARTFSLAHDILRPLVGPEPEVDGLAQFALARPLREFDLGNQRGLDPGRGGLVLHFGRKG